jgi:hypothetical protein
VLCPENYWLQNAGYDVRACFDRCKTLNWDMNRVKPTLTGVEGHTMSEAIIRRYRAPLYRDTGLWPIPGILLWRGDMLAAEDYRLVRIADDLSLR